MAAMLGRLFQQARKRGDEVLVLHGGGKQLTSFLDRMGVKSNFVNGLRVTSAEALDGVVKVFAGTVNHNLLAALYGAGVPAVGISGIDGGCLHAERLRGAAGEDWGFVGNITAAKPQVWETILSGGLLPVMACVAVGDGGQIYNVNADQAAVACAVHWRADSLVFLTDVDGVRDGAGRRMPRLSGDEISVLIQSGVATGGMLAKLNAVAEALSGGVGQIVIRDGHRDDALEEDDAAGTVIVSALPVAKKI
jgi:acetylglutamate kinase